MLLFHYSVTPSQEAWLPNVLDLGIRIRIRIKELRYTPRTLFLWDVVEVGWIWFGLYNDLRWSTDEQVSVLVLTSLVNCNLLNHRGGGRGWKSCLAWKEPVLKSLDLEPEYTYTTARTSSGCATYQVSMSRIPLLILLAAKRSLCLLFKSRLYRLRIPNKKSIPCDHYSSTLRYYWNLMQIHTPLQFQAYMESVARLNEIHNTRPHQTTWAVFLFLRLIVRVWRN